MASDIAINFAVRLDAKGTVVLLRKEKDGTDTAVATFKADSAMIDGAGVRLEFGREGMKITDTTI
jgi:hypothetical protein